MAINTIKFSEMTAGGDLGTNDKTPGLLGGGNVLFNNPWTFLPPGTTGDRPAPTVSIYYRLRFNNTLEVYEYYDPTTLTWTQLSGTGTGTVNPGVANDIAFYAANGQAVSPIAGAINAVLISNGAGVPSMSSTLPTGLSIPGAIITASTAALLSGSVAAAPVAGIDLTNKTYVDSLFSSGVASIVGSTNQVLANGTTGIPQTGIVTLSLPQDIALGSTPSFAGLTLTSIPLNPASGGTGINNGSRTLTLAGNLSTVGAFPAIFNFTASTNVTFPTSGTLATTGQLPTPAALSRTDDTNVTMTLGGTPLTALLQATSMTLGWTGQLSVPRGGSGLASATAYAVLCGGTASTGAFQSVASVGTAGQFLLSNGPGALPSFQTVAIGGGTVNAGTINQVAWYASTGSAVSGLATANSGVLVTSGAGVPSISTTLPNMNIGTPTAGVLTNTTGGGGLRSFQVFTTGTAATYTKPANVTSILVEVLGGGGAGGGGTSASGAFIGTGAGGGSGGYARLWVPSASGSYTYTVGAAGAAGAAGNNPGGNGGTTTFSASSLQATGGTGGSGGASTATTAVGVSLGGNAGVGSNGNFNARGQPGSVGISLTVSAVSGQGGSSIYGGGGASIIAAATGVAAGNYGSGGSGGIAVSGNVQGGVGTAGLIIVWEFS